jgi:plastocyanin
VVVLTSLVAIVTLVCGSFVADQGTKKGAQTHTVVMEGTGFQPADLKIAAGETVVWVNKDPFPHTATATNGDFDSKEIEPGKSWKHTFKAKGDFAYVCTLHPTMKATVKVE